MKAVAAALACLALALFWPLLRGETLYDVRTLDHYLEGRPGPAPHDRGDTILSLPMLHRAYGEGLRSGELRLWNPLLFCGAPAYNNLLLHPFYPPNLVLFTALPWRAASDASLLLHFLGAGLSMAALLRGLGRSPGAALVGALLWVLPGYVAYWFSPGTMMGLSVFLPLALLGLHRAIEGRSLRPALLGGLALGAALLGSHGQHGLLAVIFISLWGSACAVRDRRLPRETGVLLLAGLGVGAAALLTQADSILNGVRIAGGDFDLHYARPFKLPGYLLGAFASPWTPRDPLLASEFTITIGTAGAALALAGAWSGRREGWTRFLAVVACAVLLIAFLSPLAWLAAKIPLLNLSMPARWLYLYVLAVPWLAARGLDSILERSSSPRATAAAAAVLVAAELAPFFAAMNRPAPPRLPPMDLAAPDRTLGSDGRPSAGRFTQDGWRIGIGANLLALRGASAVGGYESIAPAASVALAVAISGPEAVMGSGRVIAILNLQSRWLDLAGARRLLMPFDHQPGGRWLPVPGSSPPRYENPDALPRAYLTDAATVDLRPPPDGHPVVQGQVRWIRDESDRIELEAGTDRPRLLVVSDTHYPGWEADLDGVPVPIRPAYGVFRAIEIPPGRHRVRMVFRPASARAGILISALSSLVAFGFALRRPGTGSRAILPA